jgi:hypothetical protein
MDRSGVCALQRCDPMTCPQCREDRGELVEGATMHAPGARIETATAYNAGPNRLTDVVGTLNWELQYSSSSYAIGAGPKTLVQYNVFHREWCVEFVEYDQELGTWVGYALDDKEAAAFLLRWLSGHFEHVPSSIDQIKRWASDYKACSVSCDCPRCSKRNQGRPRRIAGAPVP